MPTQETWVQSLGREDLLEKEMALQYSCLKKSHGQRSLAGYSPWGCKGAGHDLANQHNNDTPLGATVRMKSDNVLGAQIVTIIIKCIICL